MNSHPRIMIVWDLGGWRWWGMRNSRLYDLGWVQTMTVMDAMIAFRWMPDIDWS